MTDADWLGKEQRRNVRWGKPASGERVGTDWAEVSWKSFCDGLPIEIWNRRPWRGRWYSDNERMKWE